MSVQPTAGYQQDYQDCMHDLDSYSSSMYKPQEQDLTNAHNPPCFEPPYGNYHMSSGQIYESRFDNPIDTEAWINQSMATPKASSELYHALSDVEVPSVRPPTIQCDPWCSAAVNRTGRTSLISPILSPTTAPVSGNLAGSLIAMPGMPVKDAGLVPYGDGEQDHSLKKHSKAETWPNGYLLPFSEYPTEDNHLQGITLGVASPSRLDGLAYSPWNGSTTSLNPFLPVPTNDGTFKGHEGSGFSQHGDWEQNHTLRGELKAERGPHGYHVPVGYLPAGRSDRRRRRRRFTNGEKMIISYKRKVGVCRDCRHAKRKCTHVPVDIENDDNESGAGVIKTQPHGSSVLDGPRRSKLDVVERQDNDFQGQVL